MQLHTALFDTLDEYEGLPIDMAVQVAVSLLSSLAILAEKQPEDVHRLTERAMRKIAHNRDVLRASNYMALATPAEA